MWTIQLRHGIRISAGALLTLALLVLGLWFVPWFSSDESPASAPPSETADGTVSIKLTESTVCHIKGHICGDGSTTQIEAIPSGLAISTLAVGALFGLVVLLTDFRRAKYGELTWLRIGMVAVLGLAAAILILISLKMFEPASIAYEITPSHRYGNLGEQPVTGVTEIPTLASGAFVALAGVLLGCITAWMGRPYANKAAPEADAPIVAARVEAPRPVLGQPPRGVETDPFRAPPAPPPIAAITTHARPTEAPRADSAAGDAPGPSLLR